MFDPFAVFQEFVVIPSGEATVELKGQGMGAILGVWGGERRSLT